MKRSSLVRKTPMARVKPESGILRTAHLGEPGAPKLAAKPKMHKCSICKAPFQKRSMTHVACNPSCAEVVAAKKREKTALQQAKHDRATTRARKEAVKTIPQLKAEAQVAFNAYIRERDKDQPCICCGNWPLTDGSLSGGSWDAAHYRSRGSADHLRYDENNVHRALKNCNQFGHEDYRGGLIARIGLDAVEALERNQTIVKWTADMLRGIRDTYRAKLKELQAKEGR